MSHKDAIDTYRNSPDNFGEIFDAAALIRKEILKSRNWKFEGDYSGYEPPITLKTLLQWIIIEYRFMS